MSDLISVVVPVYNTAVYLERCIDSILGQSHPHMEPIFSDDGSADQSAEILDTYALRDERILVIHKPNSGVTNTRIYGMKLAQGDSIGFADSDDEIAPDMYACLYGNMKEYGADISHCGYRMYYEDGTEQDFYNTGKVLRQDRQEALKSLLNGTIEPALVNKLFSAKICRNFLKDGRMDTYVRNFEDLLMNYYLFKNAESSVMEDRCLYFYFKRSGSAYDHMISENLIWEPIHVKEIIYEDLQSTELENDAGKSFLDMCIHIYHLVLRSDCINGNEKLKRIRMEIGHKKIYRRSLPIKNRIILWAIRKIPMLYNQIYRIYGKAKY